MIKILNHKNELLSYIKNLKRNHKSIGFAPTMGALHEGHLSLYHNARKENDIVISSIFVNPTQFNNTEDLEKYPRNIEKDIEKLNTSELVDAVYIPSMEDIYPQEAKSKSYNFGGIENEMEGAFRPGHFDGVGTVVEEFFRQIQPDNAYFGEKDFQQLAIIRKLVEITNLNIQIHGVPIFRENNGLAMSSRNERLSQSERNDAKIIFETLHQVKEWTKRKRISDIKKEVENIFHKKEGMKLEYFIIADEKTLKEVEKIDPEKSFRAFIVVYVGEIRLIDNLHLV